MELNEQIKIETDPIYQKVSKVIPEIEWAFHAPLIHKINKLKKETNKIRETGYDLKKIELNLLPKYIQDNKEKLSKFIEI